MALLLLWSSSLLAQDWNQIIKTVASDRRTSSTAGRGAGDHFGSSVAIDGDYAVVSAGGAGQDAGGGNTLQLAGSAFVFKRVNGTWTQVKKLVASDRGVNDQFACSVAISGSLIVVGSHQEDEDASGGNTLNEAGSAYIFSQNQGGADNWGQVKKLVAADRETSDLFGHSVAISGEQIVVSALLEDHDASGGNTLSEAGSAYVFSQNQGGANNWGQVKKLVASDRGAGDRFGSSVAINGGQIVIGAYGDDKDASGGNTLNLAGSAYVFSQDQGGTDNWGQVKKLVAADRGAEDGFGVSVSISGDLIVVGAAGEDQDATGANTLSFAGSAYVFSRSQGGADNWRQVKKLVAADRAAFDRFGASVGISGSQIVVGAFDEAEDASGGNTLSVAGSAYIFSQNQGGADNWGQIKKLVASDRGPNDQFGISVAISGSLIAVGANSDGEDDLGGNAISGAGSAYVFNQSQGGADNWGQEQKIVLSDYQVDVNYGYSVAIDGDYAVVGAYKDGIDANSGQPIFSAGSAYVLKRQNGTWTQVKKLVASDRGPNDHFGYSVAISGSLIVVGAHQEDEDASGGNTLNLAGSAYIFSQNQGGTDNWGQVKKLVASDRGPSDQFGISVAISGSLIVVGAYQEDEDASGGNTVNLAGSAYIFSQNQGGADNWGQVKKIVASDRSVIAQFGISVAISGSLIVVGAYGDNVSGAAYVFSQSQGGTDNWGQVKKLVASDQAASDSFGFSVGISGNTIVVGAYAEDEDASGSNTLTGAGSAYVFSQNQGGANNWGQVKKLVASDRAASDSFGFSVGISGNTIVVGAYAEDEDASGSNTLTGAGSAYVFSQNQGGANNWGQVKKLAASDRESTSQFGTSVAISGIEIVAGTPYEDKDASGGNAITDAGAAYFFRSNQPVLTGLRANPGTVCLGSVTTFTASIGNLTSSYSYTLTNGSNTTIGTGSSETLSQSLVATGSGTQTFTLIVSQNGSATTTIASLTVNAKPSPSITSQTSFLTCTTPSISLTATGGVSYLWTDNSTDAIRTVTSPGVYSVIVTNINGCTAIASRTIASNMVLNLSAGASLPQANVGVVVSLTASGATAYQWSAPSTVLLTSPTTGSALSASLTTAGVQTFTLVASAGVCSQSALVSVTALAGPDLSAIMSLPDGNFQAGESKGLLMQLQEVNGSTASGSIVITITVPTGYSVSFDNSLTSINVSGGSTNPVSVQNNKWHLSSSVAGQQVSLSINGGESVVANSTLNLGFTITRTTANAGSVSNITVNIADDSGGQYDVNQLNNIYARVISGL
ncbi:hypothetical protein GCM10028809_02090 [Spirosoma gilvum]